MKPIPLLTNKDVKRINGKLVVVVPDGCGGFTPLQTKDTTPKGGEKLLELANSQVSATNSKLMKVFHWNEIARLAGFQLFDYDDQFDELNWKRFRPNIGKMVSILDASQSDKVLFIIVLTIQIYYGSNYLKELKLNPINIESFVILNKKERMVFFRFLTSL